MYGRLETSTTSGLASRPKRASTGSIRGSLSEERTDASDGSSFCSPPSSPLPLHFKADSIRTIVFSYSLMEKDNKAARVDARREYNETVRVRPPSSSSPAPRLPAPYCLTRLSLSRPSSPTSKNAIPEPPLPRSPLPSSPKRLLPPPPPATPLANPRPNPQSPPLPPPPHLRLTTSFSKTGRPRSLRRYSTSPTRRTTNPRRACGSASSAGRRDGARGGGGITRGAKGT